MDASSSHRGLLGIACVVSLCACELPGTPGSLTAAGPSRPTTSLPIYAIENVDILFEIDNSSSMAENQANLARNFNTLIDQLVNPPINPATMRPDLPPVKSLHVGIISSDLGTPGSVVPSCANSDTGDDGFLNPIKSGLAIRTHLPWTTAPAGRRPTRCTNDPNQYPSFLTFTNVTTAGSPATDMTEFRDDFVCNAYLSTGGCGLEQQLESAYRALVWRNPRAQTGNTDPNAGLVRDNAVLAIVMVTDEEDGSVRDCRFEEGGVPCTDAVGVFDIMSPDWSSSDLNLRFYMYTPGSRQDPTWAIDRYIDTTRPNRGFTSLKPGRPDLVIFSAITGVPLSLPMRAASSGGGMEVDYDTLLGRRPDGSDGYTGEQTGSGPVSMRQRNMDPMCSTRVVPACRREGSPAVTTCDPGSQYIAWPSRRVVQVARRFTDRYNSGTVSSICANNYTPALTRTGQLIQSRLSGRCIGERTSIQTEPVNCADGSSGCRRLKCVLREILPPGTSTSVCTAARGRTVGESTPSAPSCIVDQVFVTPGGAPPATREGFYLDTRPLAQATACSRHIEFTANAGLYENATAMLDCN
jgi:hypothetical protein